MSRRHPQDALSVLPKDRHEGKIMSLRWGQLLAEAAAQLAAHFPRWDRFSLVHIPRSHKNQPHPACGVLHRVASHCSGSCGDDMHHSAPPAIRTMRAWKAIIIVVVFFFVHLSHGTSLGACGSARHPARPTSTPPQDTYGVPSRHVVHDEDGKIQYAIPGTPP